MAAHEEPTFLFEAPIGRWCLIGALLGGVGVMAAFIIGVLVADLDRAVIGAAGLVAPFGGMGFGAMMGAVLGGLRAGEIEADERRAARDGEAAATLAD